MFYKAINKKPQMRVFSTLGIAISMLFAANTAMAKGASKEDREMFLRPAEIPQPADNKLTQARIDLGKALFFDPRLSGSNWISCATCHNPTLGWSDGLKTAIGDRQKVLGRATPTILNTAYQRFQFWDGRERTLEAQALGPIAAKGEMNQNLDELVKELKAVKGYHPLFEAAYPGEGISKKTIGKAIASFERSIVSTESPFDAWLKGNKKAMSESAVRGFELFKGKARCILCHQGHNFIDDGFHNIGLPNNKDEGRYAIKKVKVLKGAFKTPTLRDIGKTAPYMHNGVFATLEEVVNHYNGGGKDNMGNKSPTMSKLNLSSKEKKDLVTFLRSLSGKPQNVVIPELPANN